MKTQSRSCPLTAALTIAALATALTAGTTVRAMTPAMSAAGTASLATGFGPNSFEAVAFTDSAEASMLRQAYKILATGDHNYKGHRVKAMHQVEAAAKILGMDIAGDLKDRTPQLLSDARLREANGLIRSVRNSAEVKDQDRVTRHLDAAIAQIDTALGTR